MKDYLDIYIINIFFFAFFILTKRMIVLDDLSKILNDQKQILRYVIFVIRSNIFEKMNHVIWFSNNFWSEEFHDCIK